MYAATEIREGARNQILREGTRGQNNDPAPHWDQGHTQKIAFYQKTKTGERRNPPCTELHTNLPTIIQGHPPTFEL